MSDNEKNLSAWLASMHRQDLLVRWLIEDTGLDDAVIRALLPVARKEAAKPSWDVAVLWRDGYRQLNIVCWDSADNAQSLQFAFAAAAKGAQVFHRIPSSKLLSS